MKYETIIKDGPVILSNKDLRVCVCLCAYVVRACVNMYIAFSPYLTIFYCAQEFQHLYSIYSTWIWTWIVFQL